jgi:molybdate transport system substrate-binding protein
MHRIAVRSLIAALALILSTGLASADDLRVITVGALQVAMRNLVADYNKSTKPEVILTITNPALLSKALSQGSFDVIIAPSPALEELDKAGGLQGEGRVKVGRVGIGVAIREGAPKPDLSTPDAFKQAVSAAKSFVYTDPSTPNASGAVTQRILAAAGLLDMVKAKGRQEGLVPARELIAAGTVEMGFFNVSEATAKNCVLAGPVPAPLQQYTSYDGAVMAKSAAAGPAAAFLKFVTAKSVAAQWTAAGVDAM